MVPAEMVPTAHSPSSTGSSAPGFIWVPTPQPQLTCSLDFLSCSPPDTDTVIWACAHREAPVLTCPLDPHSRGLFLLILCVWPCCVLGAEDVSSVQWAAATPSSVHFNSLRQLFLSWVFFLRLGSLLEFPFHFYSYSPIITAK